MQKRILFLVLLSSLAWTTFLKAQEPVFRSIGIAQGLPSSEVYRVIQDKNGLIWMSTDAGLCRFNGYSIQCFTSENGLPDNTIFDLLEDQSGRIWLNSYNGALGYFEGEKFNRIPASALLQQELSKTNGIITSMAFDKDETLWIGTSTNSYFLWKKDNYSKFYFDKSYNDSANCILHVLNNQKIISSANRTDLNFNITKQKNSSLKMQIRKNGINEKINTLFPNEAFNPKICAIFNSRKEVLFTYRNKLVINTRNGIDIHQFSNTIISLYEDDSANLWVGLVNGGVFVFEKGDLSAKPKHFLSNYSISSILIDREKGLWLSTFEKGVFYAPSIEMLAFSGLPDLATSIAGLHCFGSKVYVATTSNSLYTIDKNLSVEQLSVQKDPNQSSVVNFFSYGSKLAIGGNKMSVFDTLTKQFHFLENKHRISYYGTSMSVNQNNDLVFVALGEYFEIQNNQVLQKANLPARATYIFRVASNKWWLGTLKGLYKFDGHSIEKINHEQLAVERINYINQDKHGRIYVATKNKGLFIFDKNKWMTISKSKGLSSDICNAVFCDDKDSIWVATNNGISYFKAGDISHISILNSSHGLNSNEIKAVTRLNNLLFVGSKEGLNCLDLRSEYSVASAPQVLILKAKEVKSNAVITANAQLESANNSISFSIACPSFKNLFHPVYTYQLQGFSDSIHWSSNEVLEFQNLQPGNYKLILKAVNNDGIFSNQDTSFNFQIKTPFYLKKSFIALELVLAGLIIYLLTRWRINVARRKERIKSEMLAAITESRMTALQAQMNPHFIFNAINSIQSLILNKDTQNAYDYLAKFARLVRLVLNNSKHNQIHLQTELETLQLYVEMEQLRFKNSFEFVIHSESLQEQLNEIEIPVMLIQPFIENAIWHGIVPLNETRKGRIDLSIRLQKPFLHISILDNGVGRQQSIKPATDKNHKSLGIQLVEERLALIQTTSNEKATLELIDLTDERGIPCGTQITILLPYEND